jgi:hypothetical protein
MAGIGPATSPLPRECSTTEPHGRFAYCYCWSGRRGSNSRHLAWKASALPTELHPHYAEHPRRVLTDPLYSNTYRQSFFLVERAGFEPAYSERTDLQSVAFNHSATSPKNRPRLSRLMPPTSMSANINLVPGIGIELMTFALQVRCSTN